MADRWVVPGEAAHRAFRTGTRAAALAGLGAIGVLYWLDVLAPLTAGVALVLLFPVYLLVVASALSKWLGFDKGVADLRPVVRERETPRER